MKTIDLRDLTIEEARTEMTKYSGVRFLLPKGKQIEDQSYSIYPTEGKNRVFWDIYESKEDLRALVDELFIRYSLFDNPAELDLEELIEEAD